MINFPAICIANGAAIMLLAIILFNLKRSLRHGFFEEKIYYAMVILNILQCIFETTVFFADGKLLYGYRTLSIVLNTALFINNIIFAYLWTIYSDYKLFTNMKRIRRIYPFMAIPAMIVIIGSLINLARPVFFVVDKYNVYQRTDLFNIPYAVTYFYLSYGLILIYLYRKKVHKYLFLPAILFLIPIIIASMLQFFFYGYSLVWLGVSIGMTALYISLQNESAYVDALSGLFNRRYLNNILLLHSTKGSTASTLAGILLDIDEFKSINDRFGHIVGDDAISSVGMILRQTVGDKGILCRSGGDEFIILAYIKSQQEIMDIIDTIKKEAALFNELEDKPYKIHFSIGYSTYETKNETIDDFLKKMDDSMYEDKRRRIEEKAIADRRQNP